MATLPSAEQTKTVAMLTRIYLMQQHKGGDWRELSYDEIKQFLFHLFGESKIGTGTGIFIGVDEKGRIVATFEGQVEFYHKVVDGRATCKLLSVYAEMYNADMRREFDRAMKKIKDEKQSAMKKMDDEQKAAEDYLKPLLAVTIGGTRAWSGSRQFHMGNPGQ